MPDTLLDDLEAAAAAAESDEVLAGVSARDEAAARALAARLHAAAVRLREEMERAKHGGNDWFLALRALERINGGQL